MLAHGVKSSRDQTSRHACAFAACCPHFSLRAPQCSMEIGRRLDLSAFFLGLKTDVLKSRMLDIDDPAGCGRQSSHLLNLVDGDNNEINKLSLLGQLRPTALPANAAQ
ncbi:hypothetical protein LIA77_00519 [Sarocladium implicatum]|nr:hypothetical protein LIA77_00519 [Sarocladium implicatum]